LKRSFAQYLKILHKFSGQISKIRPYFREIRLKTPRFAPTTLNLHNFRASITVDTMGN